MRGLGIGLVLAAVLGTTIFVVNRTSVPSPRRDSGASATPPAPPPRAAPATSVIVEQSLAVANPSHITARLAGTVFLPPSWRMSPDLTFFLLTPDDEIDPVEVPFSKLSPVAGTPGLFRFDAGEQRMGTWRVEAEPCGFEQIVETPSNGSSLEIVIGEPADVSIRLIDADTGLPLQRKERLWWHCRRPEAWRGGASRPIPWNATTGCYTLRAPAGEIQFDAEYGGDSELDLDGRSWLELHPGSNELTLRLARHCRLYIKLTVENGAPLRIKDAEVVKALAGARLLLPDQSADAPGTKLVTMADLAGGLVFRVRDPGCYRVQLANFPGFAPVAPFDVEVARSRKCEYTVVLRRMR